MPRNVRNFWLTLDCDGKANQVATGPKSANGGFNLQVLIRNDGSISNDKLEIVGEVLPDGSLEVKAIRNGNRYEALTLLEGKR